MTRCPAVALAATILSLAQPTVSASTQFKDATKARIDKTYAIVEFAHGRKMVVPIASLTDAERAWLTSLGEANPLPRGNSSVRVVEDPPKIKKTIEYATLVGALETVRLCPPNVPRDQIGATCMLYARVHWLDIAGYYLDLGAIYKVSNGLDQDRPWSDPRYHRGLAHLTSSFTPAPLVHVLPTHEEDPFAWAREELRKGRPVLASFPKEIWQALPPGFVASRPWSGGNVGHQVVINGFTWNAATKQGTFHIINSWLELPDFELSTEAAQGGVLVIESSLSPKGETMPEAVREIVKSITLIRAVGKSNLYEVETNLGRRRIAAASEAAARSLIENGR